MRQTSIDTFIAITQNGLLSQMREEVYSTLYTNGPLTGRELDTLLQNPNCHVRLSELHSQGVVSIVGTKKCSVSGQVTLSWDTNDNMPQKLEKRSWKRTAKEYQALVTELLGVIGDCTSYSIDSFEEKMKDIKSREPRENEKKALCEFQIGTS